jgi:hypothetical protein
MPRRTQPIKRPEIRLDATSPLPLYKQLYEWDRRPARCPCGTFPTALPRTRACTFPRTRLSRPGA